MEPSTKAFGRLRVIDGDSRLTAKMFLFWGIAGAMAALRLYYCTLLPINSGDITRHLYTGLAILKYGLASAGQPLVSVVPGARSVAWASMPYNYPIVSLTWFTTVAAVMPTIFFAKVSLSALEGLNAWLFARITGRRWLGLLYWATPASVWWVSREGQFEPIQAFFTLAALSALPRFPGFAGALLALAIQSKVTAIFLLPLLLWRSWRQGTLVALVGGVLIGAVPTLLAQTQYDAIGVGFLSGAAMHYNPYFWNPWDKMYWSWHPTWLIVWAQMATYAAIVWLTVASIRSRRPIDYLAPLAFLAACKAAVQAQFWYLVLMPSFLAPIRDRRILTMTLLAFLALEPVSAWQILDGPFGYTVGRYYGTVTPYMRLSVP